MRLPSLSSTPARHGEALDSFVEDRDFVKSFARGLLVIQAFANANQPLSIADVSRRIDIPRAAVRRLLHTLCKLGYARADGSHYSVTTKLLRSVSPKA